jgi:nondiscriminating glutamyl-tRNA synthetase
MNPVKVRIPPSPTGLLHIGTARVALFNYLFAKQNNGKIVMRIEDTDKERSKKEYEENILNGIKNLGLSWDGEVIYQSKRTEIYKKYLLQLLKEKKAYYCFSTVEELTILREKAITEKKAFRYPETWRNKTEEEVNQKLKNGDRFVIRIKVPHEKEIKFDDLIRGEISINTKEIDDFVIAKDLETPLYNFCMVIDDNESNISHIIRGEDHISNTPKQIILFEMFKWGIPKFAHLPLILNQDKSKLSKRKNKVSIYDYLASGFLKESIINFLALLGWNTSDEQEIFTMKDLLKKFSLKKVHKSGAIFSIEKLEYINKHYIKNLDNKDFINISINYLKEYSKINNYNTSIEFLEKALLLLKDRLKKLSEIPKLIELFYINDEKLDFNLNFFIHKKMNTNIENSKKSLEFVLDCLNKYDKNFDIKNLKEFFVKEIKENGFKNGFILYPVRVALSGEEFSPGTFELLEIFGKERSIKRIKKSLDLIKQYKK